MIHVVHAETGGEGGEEGEGEGRGEIQVLLFKTTSCILFHFAAAYSCLRLR